MEGKLLSLWPSLYSSDSKKTFDATWINQNVFIGLHTHWNPYRDWIVFVLTHQLWLLYFGILIFWESGCTNKTSVFSSNCHLGWFHEESFSVVKIQRFLLLTDFLMLPSPDHSGESDEGAWTNLLVFLDEQINVLSHEMFKSLTHTREIMDGSTLRKCMQQNVPVNTYYNATEQNHIQKT